MVPVAVVAVIVLELIVALFTVDVAVLLEICTLLSVHAFASYPGPPAPPPPPPR